MCHIPQRSNLQINRSSFNLFNTLSLVNTLFNVFFKHCNIAVLAISALGSLSQIWFKPKEWRWRQSRHRGWEVMGTNVKINIFYLFLWRVHMTRSTNIITYLFSKIITVGGFSFFDKNPNHFPKNTQFHIFEQFTNSSLRFRFRNKYGFCSKPSLRIYQQFKSKHIFIIIWYHDFL